MPDAAPTSSTLQDSFSAIVKVLNAALEHTPPHTRELLATGVQAHIKAVDAGLRTGGPG